MEKSYKDRNQTSLYTKAVGVLPNGWRKSRHVVIVPEKQDCLVNYLDENENLSVEFGIT